MTLRMVVLILLVVMVTSLPPATSIAEASVFDTVEDFANYLYEYYNEDDYNEDE